MGRSKTPYRGNLDATALSQKRNCLYIVSCFGSRPKNFGLAIREPLPPPGQGLRGGMATTWQAHCFSENSEARTRHRRGTFFCFIFVPVAGQGRRQVGPVGYHNVILADVIINDRNVIYLFRLGTLEEGWRRGLAALRLASVSLNRAGKLTGFTYQL